MLGSSAFGFRARFQIFRIICHPPALWREREREREREKENTRRPRRCLEKRREEERELFVFISPDDDDDDDRRIELTKLTEETSDELELELWSGRESSSEA